jgi:hypothetical protein
METFNAGNCFFIDEEYEKAEKVLCDTCCGENSIDSFIFSIDVCCMFNLGT